MDEPKPQWIPPTDPASAFGPPGEAERAFGTPPARPPAAPVRAPVPQGHPQTTPGKATAALCLGICGIFLPLLLSIPAIYYGVKAKQEIEADPVRFAGSGQALWGIILGAVGTFLGVMAVIGILAGA